MKLLVFVVVATLAGYGSSFDIEHRKSLEIVPITEWGGSELQYEDKLAKPVPFAIIHHTVSPACDTDRECLNQVNNIRNYFLLQGWSKGDIPYSFMIGGNGKVYEGAGWHNAGAHTFRYNEKSIGIGFLGDFREIPPTLGALKAAQELLNYGLQNKYLADNYQLVGAGQLTHTESPGSALQKIIESWPHWTPKPTHSIETNI